MRRPLSAQSQRFKESKVDAVKRQLADTGMSPGEIEEAKAQYKGSTKEKAPAKPEVPDEGNPVGNFFGGMDDAYMGFMRDHVLGLPKEGRVPDDGFMAGARNSAGVMLFGARPGAKDVNSVFQPYSDDFGGKAHIFTNRALHAGGITAAGAGLYELGGAIAGQFGGPADGQTSQQIRM